MSDPKVPEPTLLFLVGPTASGKSDLALLLSAPLNAHVLSMDSMSVYQGMDLGTAKPSPEDRARLPHHLLDLVTPDRPFSVADYLHAASATLDRLAADRLTPLFVGGTVLYMKALISGLFRGPAADPDLRTSLDQRARDLGPHALHAELAAVDPEAAQRLHPNDTRRIVRALEVFHLTGSPISDLQQQWADPERQRPHLIVAPHWPRPVLYRRINARVLDMFRLGLVDEVRSLLQRFGALGPTASRALGYAEVLDHLAGKHSLDETIALVQLHTRQFAKRQLTWLRRFPEIHWLAMSPERPLPEAAAEALDVFRAPRTPNPFNTGD